MNQVATKKEGALATNLFEADANQGAQNISQEDLALPFLKILDSYHPKSINGMANMSKAQSLAR